VARLVARLVARTVKATRSLGRGLVGWLAGGPRFLDGPGEDGEGGDGGAGDDAGGKRAGFGPEVGEAVDEQSAVVQQQPEFFVAGVAGCAAQAFASEVPGLR
jgi:hypothetical protein